MYRIRILIEELKVMVEAGVIELHVDKFDELMEVILEETIEKPYSVE